MWDEIIYTFPQTSTVQPLKFGNGYVISSHILLGMYVYLSNEFHQPRLVIRTFHHQGRSSRGGHLCNEHSEEKYLCSDK